MINHQLKRETFTTSRLMDFFSEKELTTQIGHPRNEWPLVCAKELIDNALDACEDAGIQPVINISLDADSISVYDNGLGIPLDTIENMLDFSIRVSSREAYVSPDRGAQGNALKTIVAMPFVLSNEQEGQVWIESQGVFHTITCKVDQIQQQPIVEHDMDTSNVKIGTKIVIKWPDSTGSELQDTKEQFLQIAESFAFLNPHLTLKMTVFDEVTEWAATNPEWTSWKPSNPTSAHWYKAEHLSRLVSAYLSQQDTEKTVREFISEFRGLVGSAKQKKVLDTTGLARAPLSELITGDRLDSDKINELLTAMKEHTTPVGPKLVGIIGEKHLRARCEELGCEMDSFNYQKQVGTDDGLPWVVEMAFAYRGDNAERRKLVAGVNWSAGIDNPFRKLGDRGQSMDTVLANARAADDDPIVMVMHMACPRVAYSDRGKSSVILEG